MNGYNLGNGLTRSTLWDPAPENYDLVTPKMTETFLIATLEKKIHGGAYAGLRWCWWLCTHKIDAVRPKNGSASPPSPARATRCAYSVASAGLGVGRGLRVRREQARCIPLPVLSFLPESLAGSFCVATKYPDSRQS